MFLQPALHALFLRRALLLLLFCLPCDAWREEGTAVEHDGGHKLQKLLPESAPVQHTQRSKSKTATMQVVVRAYWMRHGMSCANIIREFTIGGTLCQHSYQDPSLTNCAIGLASALGDQLRPKIDDNHPTWQGGPLVFSSVLVRAMETALYNFPDRPVYPIPYIAEKDRFADNMPLPWIQQLDAKLGRLPNTPNLTKRITFLPHVNPSDSPARDDAEKDSYEAFKREFPRILSALLPLHSLSAATIVPVVLVSHSGYMKDNLACRGKDKPRNNEVWVKDYNVTLAIPSVSSPPTQPILPPLRELDRNCGTSPLEPTAFPGYDGSKSTVRHYPCRLDIERCSQTNKCMPSVRDNVETCCPSI